MEIANATGRVEALPPELREKVFDVAIVGGGPAGLSAALILARCCRQVFLADAGRPRNAAASAMHGFLSREGIPPKDFLGICREQVAQFPNVELRHCEVTSCVRQMNQFQVHLADGRKVTARLLLLATGVVDEVPKIPGIEQFYGKTVHVCPYCDGWEHRGKHLVAYGPGKAGADFALELIGWTRTVTLCTDGPAELDPKDQERMRVRGIQVITERVDRLEGTDGRLARVCFKDGQVLACDALFFTAPQRPSAEFAKGLGCDIRDGCYVPTGEAEETKVPGLFVAGNASTGVQMAILAAAEGANAAFAMNEMLLEHECE